jgi:hypothetical protein
MAGAANLAKETVSAGGTGNLTLSGAVTGHVTLNNAVGTNRFFTYVIEDGGDYEIGYGYLSASTTLVRTQVQQTIVSGTIDFTSPAALTVSTSATVGIDTAAQGVMGAHSGYAFAGTGVQGIMSLGSVHGAGTASGSFNNYLNMDPFQWCASKYVTQCMVHVVGTAASAVLRIGIWSKATNGSPGRLLKEFTDSATVDCSTSGAKTATPSSGIWLPSGDYFIGAVGNNSSITIKCPQYSPSSLDLGMTSAGFENCSLYRAYTYGALPTGDESGQSYAGGPANHSYWLK